MKAPLRLGIVFGGVGPEHEASLSSAWALIQNLNRKAYHPKLFGACKDGSWLVGEGAWERLYRSADPELLPSDIRSRSPSPGYTEHFSGMPLPEFRNVDCVFPIIHGTGGEDGTIQCVLSQMALPFAGSGPRASAKAYNKWVTKQLAWAAGLPVAPAIRASRHEPLDQIEARIAARLGETDLVVKPASSGSSFGVSRITCMRYLPDALAAAFVFDATAVVEPHLRHTELFLAVLGDPTAPFVARPVLDPDPKESPSTYHDKYIDDQYPLRCPAGIDLTVEQRARDLAGAAYRMLGCRGYARVDLFLCRDTGELLLNEINTIPALAVDCAFSLGMASEGWTYPELLEEIITSTLRAPRALPTLPFRRIAATPTIAMTNLA